VGRFGYKEESVRLLQQLSENRWDHFDVANVLIELGEDRAAVPLLARLATSSSYTIEDRIRACTLLIERNEIPVAADALSQIMKEGGISVADKMRAAMIMATTHAGDS